MTLEKLLNSLHEQCGYQPLLKSEFKSYEVVTKSPSEQPDQPIKIDKATKTISIAT